MGNVGRPPALGLESGMALLVPGPGKLCPYQTRGPAADRVPDERASGTPDALREYLVRLPGPDKVLHTLSDLVQYASDASPYRFVPQVVVTAENIEDVAAVLRYAREHRRAVVFRAAGTSLNGQAQGTDILVDVRRHWTGLEVLAGGREARIGPGTTVGRANVALSRYGRLMGPDPASSSACTVGGVVANNASGMTAGVTRNSYRLCPSTQQLWARRRRPPVSCSLSASTTGISSPRRASPHLKAYLRCSPSSRPPSPVQ
ncbi:hypothetical protein GCM10010377_42490 [Streptomyces viridiviolaceus]|nr:hypothetical protein GCM10010377_42490 [Streptomyces viridiviolaceus]